MPAARIRAALLAAILLAAPGCASWSRERLIRGYGCQSEARGSFGHIMVASDVSANGRRIVHRTYWRAEFAEGLLLRMNWRNPFEPPPPRAKLRLSMTVPAQRRSWSRLEIRRDGAAGPLVFSTSSANPSWSWFETFSWERFSAMMDGADALHVALVRHDRTVIAQALLPRAVLAVPGEAAAAVRPELEADLAGFRERCSSYPSDIIA